MTIRNDIILEDTTLRDGEQAPGVAWSKDRKMRVLRALIEAGIKSIEVGIPKMGGEELEFITEALQYSDLARLIAWNRGVREDVQQSLDLGYAAVHIGLPTSDIHLGSSLGKSREWVCRQATDLIKMAKDAGAFVSISAEDVGRTERAFLQDYAGQVAEAGADRLRLSDTIGILTPEAYADRVAWVKEVTDLDLQCHCHNDFGLAVANTLAGLRAGARYFHVCINGIGERAGMPDLGQSVMALKNLYGRDTGVDCRKLSSLSALVHELTNTRPEPWRPIVGSNVFAHESGIHSNGTLKDVRTFEPIDPAEVGGQRRIVVGKHSGRAGVAAGLIAQGIQPDQALLPEVLNLVRAASIRLGGEVDPENLLKIYNKVRETALADANL